MTRTGFHCHTTGLYKSSCSCELEVHMRQWQIFMPCRNCHKLVTWELVGAG